MQGGRISLLVAVVSTAISLVIGFAVGAVAGFSGRLVDGVAMRAVDLAMTLPPVIFLLVLASIAGTGIWPTILVISLLSWPVLARMVRARLLELRERDFVVAARGMGAGLPHLLFRHAPAELDRHPRRLRDAPGRGAASCSRPGLSFLGLGVPPPEASWGNMLNGARSTARARKLPLAVDVPRRRARAHRPRHQLRRRRPARRLRPARRPQLNPQRSLVQMPLFQGVVPPVVTPLTESFEVDYRRPSTASSTT